MGTFVIVDYPARRLNRKRSPSQSINDLCEVGRRLADDAIAAVHDVLIIVIHHNSLSRWARQAAAYPFDHPTSRFGPREFGAVGRRT